MFRSIQNKGGSPSTPTKPSIPVEKEEAKTKEGSTSNKRQVSHLEKLGMFFFKQIHRSDIKKAIKERKIAIDHALKKSENFSKDTAKSIDKLRFKPYRSTGIQLDPSLKIQEEPLYKNITKTLQLVQVGALKKIHTKYDIKEKDKIKEIILKETQKEIFHKVEKETTKIIEEISTPHGLLAAYTSIGYLQRTRQIPKTLEKKLKTRIEEELKAFSEKIRQDTLKDAPSNEEASSRLKALHELTLTIQSTNPSLFKSKTPTQYRLNRNLEKTAMRAYKNHLNTLEESENSFLETNQTIKDSQTLANIVLEPILSLVSKKPKTKFKKALKDSFEIYTKLSEKHNRILKLNRDIGIIGSINIPKIQDHITETEIKLLKIQKATIQLDQLKNSGKKSKKLKGKFKQVITPKSTLENKKNKLKEKYMELGSLLIQQQILISKLRAEKFKLSAMHIDTKEFYQEYGIHKKNPVIPPEFHFMSSEHRESPNTNTYHLEDMATIERMMNEKEIQGIISNSLNEKTERQKVSKADIAAHIYVLVDKGIPPTQAISIVRSSLHHFSHKPDNMTFTNYVSNLTHTLTDGEVSVKCTDIVGAPERHTSIASANKKQISPLKAIKTYAEQNPLYLTIEDGEIIPSNSDQIKTESAEAAYTRNKAQLIQSLQDHINTHFAGHEHLLPEDRDPWQLAKEINPANQPDLEALTPLTQLFLTTLSDYTRYDYDQAKKAYKLGYNALQFTQDLNAAQQAFKESLSEREYDESTIIPDTTPMADWENSSYGTSSFTDPDMNTPLYRNSFPYEEDDYAYEFTETRGDTEQSEDVFTTFNTDSRGNSALTEDHEVGTEILSNYQAPSPETSLKEHTTEVVESPLEINPSLQADNLSTSSFKKQILEAKRKLKKTDFSYKDQNGTRLKTDSQFSNRRESRSLHTDTLSNHLPEEASPIYKETEDRKQPPLYTQKADSDANTVNSSPTYDTDDNEREAILLASRRKRPRGQFRQKNRPYG